MLSERDSMGSEASREKTDNHNVLLSSACSSCSSPPQEKPALWQIRSSFQSELIGAMPRLRSFAVALSRDRDRADDLVQETLMRALSFADRFEPGTKMVPWLRTILRNQFYSEQRKRRREILDEDGVYADTLVAKAEQPGHLAYKRACVELNKLPPNMKEALLLIGVHGLSYDDAAMVMNCSKGTAKSRTHRARARLAKVLEIEDISYECSDVIVSSVMARVDSYRSDVRSRVAT
jgi:RNA polymerase sigma-70 factor (ECF subfamily)